MRKERDSLVDLESCDVREMTMCEYFVVWLKKKRLLIKDKSFDRLEQTVNLHVLPHCGMVLVRNMKPAMIQEMIFSLIEEDYSYSVIKKAYYALNNLFRDAMTSGDISKSPMMGVVLPDKKSEVIRPPKEILPFEDDECQSFIDEAVRLYRDGSNVYRLGWLFVLMLNTGMRIGKALGLRWTEVDLEKKKIHICQSVYTTKVRAAGAERKQQTKVTDTVKSKTSNRYIGLNQAAVQALERLREINGRHEYVAANKKGGLVCYNNIYKTFVSILTAVQMQVRGPHNLRHTFATHLFKQGVDVKVISKILGHASVQIPYVTYIYIIGELETNAIESIDFTPPDKVYTVLEVDA